jgi:hypothetical protein
LQHILGFAVAQSQGAAVQNQLGGFGLVKLLAPTRPYMGMIAHV